jgi:ubiquinol-cytochrome c reductase cytochrome b subunit
MYLDGLIRLFPAWELRIPPYFTLPPVFWPGIVGMGLSVMLPLLYPALERRFTKDRGHHNLLQRPRDNAGRTSLGVMVVVFWIIGVISGGNDVFAEKFDISLNAMTWAGRIGLVVLPIIAYYVTYRICLGLQQHDREVLAHGLETGILMRDPNGRFYEVHQPLAEPDEHGHTELEYNGWVVPKKMNRIGALPPADKGFFKSIEEPSEDGRAERRDEIESGRH